MKNIRIYIMAHKAFQVPENQIYIPMQVGAALHDRLDYIGDDSGDHISAKNSYYSELTGFYWMWKNGPDCDITGLCHYRRFFWNENRELLSAEAIEQILQTCDMIVSEMPSIEHGESIYDQYAKSHHKEDLDILREVLAERQPDYLSTYDEVMQGREMYFGNMMITSKPIADAYAEWLFDLLSGVEERIDLSEYNDYDKRIFGFLSERLMLVWIRKNSLRARSMKIGIIADKAETKEVRARAFSLLKEGKQKAVLEYLRQVEEKRPDVFDGDSDEGMTLLQTQAFAELIDAEERMGKSSLKAYSTNFYELQTLLKKISEYVKELPSDESFFRLVSDCNLSPESIILFLNMLTDEKERKIIICNYFANQYLDHGQIEYARIYVAASIQAGR